MSRFQKSLEETGALDVTRAVHIGTEKYLIFTRYSEADSQWLIGATNGLEVWVVELSEKDLKQHSGSQEENNFLADLSQSLRDGDVQLLKSHNHLTLCVKTTSEVEFSLFECSAAKKKVEMKSLLFSLWDSLHSTRTRLTKCEEELVDARKHKTSEQPAFAEVSSRSSTSKAAANRPKRIAGASLINPQTKRLPSLQLPAVANY